MKDCILWTRESAADTEWCESTRWLEDSVRLLVPTSVSLSEPRVSYSSDSDLPWLTLCVLCNGAEDERPPRTLVYRLQSDCNQTELVRWIGTFARGNEEARYTDLSRIFRIDLSVADRCSATSVLAVNLQILDQSYRFRRTVGGRCTVETCLYESVGKQEAYIIAVKTQRELADSAQCSWVGFFQVDFIVRGICLTRR